MENKYALITGATSGIGYELAKIFAKEGYNLVLIARSNQNLKLTAIEMKEISPRIDVQTIAIDLFDRQAPKEIFVATHKLGITVNVLVNNAGQGEWGKFLKTDLEREIDLIELNIISLLSLTKFYVQEMVDRNEGKILFLASSVSKVPSPYLSVYASTKSFVLTFAEALAEELKKTNVTITALLPDATDTDFFHKAKAENSVTYKEKKLYTPTEVAKAGFDGLFRGDSLVVPGFLNKLQKVINSFMPDSIVAANMSNQLKFSLKKQGRNAPDHIPSIRERETINSGSCTNNGDY